MDENIANTVDDVNVSTSSDDNSMMSFVKLIVVVLIGGLIVKLFKKAVNWFKEGQRLRREEKDRKNQKEFEELVEKKAQEKLDSLLAKEVGESKEKASEDK